MTAEGFQRDAIIDEFRNGNDRLLIAANVVLSRGIEVRSVSIMINYDIPDEDGQPDPETYLYRIGRAGILDY